MKKNKDVCKNPAPVDKDVTPALSSYEDDEIKSALSSVDGNIRLAASILEAHYEALRTRIRNSKALTAFIKQFREQDERDIVRRDKTIERMEYALLLAPKYSCNKTLIAKEMNLSKQALCMWITRDEHFRERWKEIEDSLGDHCEHVIYEDALIKKNPKSAHVILRAKFQERGYRFESKQDVTVNISHEEILNAIAKDKQ